MSRGGAKRGSLVEAVGLVADGARIGFGGSNALWRRPMAFVRELIRQDRASLHVHNMMGGLEVDLLIAAEKVGSTACCYVGLDELGRGDHFQAAAADGSIGIHEHSEFRCSTSRGPAGACASPS